MLNKKSGTAKIDTNGVVAAVLLPPPDLPGGHGGHRSRRKDLWEDGI